VIPRAVILSVVGAGFLFVIGAYGLVGAFHGVDPGLDQAEAPLAVVAAGIHLDTIGTLISIGVALSFFACALGSVNAGARVLFQLSRQGVCPPAIGRAHARYGTPHVAVSLIMLSALILSLALQSFGVAPIDALGYLGTTATFGFLLTYILVGVAAPLYLQRIGHLRPRHLALAAATVLLLAIPLIGSIYPVPAWPISLLPYIFLALLAAGMAQFYAVRRRSPHRLSAIEADGQSDAPQTRP
jgi:amino acid transporter